MWPNDNACKTKAGVLNINIPLVTTKLFKQRYPWKGKPNQSYSHDIGEKMGGLIVITSNNKLHVMLCTSFV